jgi:hypothetical protein
VAADPDRAGKEKRDDLRRFAQSLRREAKFLIPFAENPLKRLDSES